MKRPSKILKLLSPKRVLWEMPSGEKSLYLTFDDGPCAQFTPAIIALLKRFEAQATFFCLGKNVKSQYEIFRQLQDEGHTLGHHGYEHLNGWKTTTTEYMDNLVKSQTLYNSALFRPPYGKMSLKQYYKISRFCKIVMWSHMAYDFSPDFSLEKGFNELSQSIRDGSVIVLHDNAASGGNALPLAEKLLEHYTAQGFRFFALPDS